MSKSLVKIGGGHYEVLGVDFAEKKYGVPLYGWAAGAAAAIYYMFFRKRR